MILIVASNIDKPLKKKQDAKNDICSNAISITSTNMVIYGSTVPATVDFISDLEETCGTAVGSRGVWFSYTGTKKVSILRLDYQLFSIGNGVSELSMFTGPCEDLKCSINGEGSEVYRDWNALAFIEFIPETSMKYLFLLTGQTFDTVGDYELRISEYDIPRNDKCGEAIPVSPFPAPELVLGDNFGATPDFEADDIETCGVRWDSRGVWYSLEGRGTAVKIEYQLYSYHQGNTELSVFTGPCVDLTCVTNVEAGQPWNEWNGLLVHEFFAKKGETYKLLLSGEHFMTRGQYEFKVSEYQIPSNDNCKDSHEITDFKKMYSGSTLGATPDFVEEDIEYCGVTSIDTRGVWYRLTGHGQTFRIEYQLYHNNQGNSNLSVFKGSCGDWSCVGNAEAAPNDILFFEFDSIEGENYLIYVGGGTFGAAGDYTLTMTENA